MKTNSSLNITHVEGFLAYKTDISGKNISFLLCFSV